MSIAALDGALDGATDIAGARRILTGLLQRSGRESPALDARLLIGYALDLDHTAMASNPGRALSPAERTAIARLAERRLAGEPVARILGVKEFWGLPFALSKATLVPRPETETIVEAALEALGAKRNEALRIADLGIGTGALLLALLHELKNATGIGTDLDANAIETAHANARTLGLADRAQFLRTDFGAGLVGEGLAPSLAPPFDLVVSNPPYIPTQDIATLAVEVREHDPKLALDGGDDGLHAYRTLARQLPTLLEDRGIAVLEIGIGQAEAVGAILELSGVWVNGMRADVAGIARALVISMRPKT